MSGPTTDAVIARLRTVKDPCSLALGSPVDIWELGLVEEVGVDGGQVRVRLVLTDPSCVYFRTIRQHVVDVVGALPGVEAVEVSLVTTVLWTAERMRTGSA